MGVIAEIQHGIAVNCLHSKITLTMKGENTGKYVILECVYFDLHNEQHVLLAFFQNLSFHNYLSN